MANFQVSYDLQLASCGTKHLALYYAIRDSIVSGTLPLGEKLPSTRALASLYQLSRGSVSVAYEMLAAEGFVRSAVGQGTFVAGVELSGDSVADNRRTATQAAVPAFSTWGARLIRDDSPMRITEDGVSELGSAIAPSSSSYGEDDAIRTEPVPISFSPRGMGEQWFPWMSWRAAVTAEWKRLGPSEAEKRLMMEGSLALRGALAGRLRRERGIVCTPEDIVITGGSMQAIALIAQLLLEEGTAAVAEDPSYSGTRRAILASGAAMIAAPVDRHGIIPQEWAARLLFVTPTRQFPTGAVLTYERRVALLQWASRQDAWILEDDYDSEFRWGGRPIEPLKSLDSEGRVIYVGSFSRSMRSEIRIGYAVLPPAIREAFIRAKQLYDPHPEGIAEQGALAGWMAEGEYDRHLRRSRRIFHRLQDRLRSKLEGELGELFDVYPADAGLLLYAVWRQSPEQYDRLQALCHQQGVCWGDGARYAVSPQSAMRTALFGFAHLDEPEIEAGMERLCQAAKTLGLIRERGGIVDA